MTTSSEPRIAHLPSGTVAYALRRHPCSRRLRVTLHPQHGVVVSVSPADQRGWARPEPTIERFLAEREPWLLGTWPARPQSGRLWPPGAA